MSPLRWTCKSRAKLTAALTAQGWRVSSTTVGLLLHALGYRLQALRKTQEGTSQCTIRAYQPRRRGVPRPAATRDLRQYKAKELVGEFKNPEREWQPTGTPEPVRVHDFPSDAVGKAIPYGVYDMARNEAWVSVGRDHDTPAFAVAAIRQWWTMMGRAAYPAATALLITADAGGSNGARLRLWKWELQQLATRTGLVITVCHFPPGTSKWNKIEHRLFSHIAMNWRGTPLVDLATIVSLIGSTRSRAGLHVRAELDRGRYPAGIAVTDAQLATVQLTRHRFHGDWNYTIYPATTPSVPTVTA